MNNPFRKQPTAAEAQATVDGLTNQIEALDDSLAEAQERQAQDSYGVETGAEGAAEALKKTNRAIARITADLNTKRGALAVAKQQLSKARAAELVRTTSEHWRQIEHLAAQRTEAARSLQTAIDALADDIRHLAALTDQLAALSGEGVYSLLSKRRIYTGITASLRAAGINLSHPELATGDAIVTDSLVAAVEDGNGLALKGKPGANAA